MLAMNVYLSKSNIGKDEQADKSDNKLNDLIGS
jgi:hypothetical protein